jgi:hypothetical protein
MKPKKSPGLSLSVVTTPDAVRYRRTKIGDCTCGYGFPDLLIGARGGPPKIVMICPECGEQWELGFTQATRESMAAVLGIKKGGR